MQTNQIQGLFPTVGMMKLLLLMYNKPSLSFSEQKFVTDSQYFKMMMEILMRWGKCEREDGVSFDMRKRAERFKITIKGRMWVEENIFNYRKCV